MSDLIFEVPPGIGDTLWCYMRVAGLIGEREVAFKICGDPPQRSTKYVDLLPGVSNLGYGRSYVDVRKELLPYDTDLKTLPRGTYGLSLNPWLEGGGLLGDAFPKQSICHHPSFDTSEQHVREAVGHLSLVEPGRLKIGFYCSSYAHRQDLGMWTPDEWVTFLSMINEVLTSSFGTQHEFVALGARYDDRTMEVARLMEEKGFKVVNTVGVADIGTTIELIRRLDYFFAFPSGLGIIGDAVNTPTMMWYWGGLIPGNEKFFNTYADPQTVASGRHLNLPYCKPHTAAMIFDKRGKRHIGSAP